MNVSHRGRERLAACNVARNYLDSVAEFRAHPVEVSGKRAYREPVTQQTRDDRRHGIGNRRIHATFGDSSAVITIRTFSGDITIQKR